MDLSIADVEERVDEHVEAYRESAPFYPVEKESIELLPGAFRAGEYGKRDVEWVVRWYFRRRVDAIDHERRRESEERIGDTDRTAMRKAMWDAVDALDESETDPNYHRALDALTRLPGIDVAVGSALLWFLDPDRFFVIGDREWRVVAAITDLDEPYPDPVTVEAYDRYLDAVRTLADRLDIDHWRLYMVVQRLYVEEFEEA